MQLVWIYQTINYRKYFLFIGVIIDNAFTLQSVDLN